MASTRTKTFTEVNRKQAFNGLVQEVILEPSKQYIDLESYFDDLVEYLQPQMDKMLQSKGRGLQFWWSVQVRYSTPLMKTVDYDDEENWFVATTMMPTMMLRTNRHPCSSTLAN